MTIIETINKYVGTPNIFDDSRTPRKLIKVTKAREIRDNTTLYGCNIGNAEIMAAVEDDMLTLTVMM